MRCATSHMFVMQLAAMEAQTRCRGRGNTKTSKVIMKQPKFDGSMPLTLCHYSHYQFKALAITAGQPMRRP
jgi:hypothetical protein